MSLKQELSESTRSTSDVAHPFSDLGDKGSLSNSLADLNANNNSSVLRGRVSSHIYM